MILKGSQRGGARALATHLLKDENDHVTVSELRGFATDNLYGAMAEVEAVAKGTKAKQAVFSLSLNPPKDTQVAPEAFYAAADKAEEALGLTGQPRAIVLHEKQGRIHCHVVWSRIDADQMKAINLPYFKFKLNALSKELYLEHGWELPDGLKENGWKSPLNFSLAEWQQAKRLDLDPRELKSLFQSAWKSSDSLASFKNALEEHGYYLAQGDRRRIVAVDLQGNVISVSRVVGSQIKAKLGNGAGLSSVDEVRAATGERLSKNLRANLKNDLEAKKAELKPMLDAASKMALAHRAERQRLQQKQEERRQQENKLRASRFRRGLGAVADFLSGRMFKTRRENEREAFAGHLRDRTQRESLFAAQLKERAALQKNIEAKKKLHREDRMRTARQISQVLRFGQAAGRGRSRPRDRGPELER